MTRFAKFISLVFHPLWMPLYLFLGAWWIDPYLRAFLPTGLLKYLLFVLGINILAPLVSILMLRYRNLISSFHLRKREERLLPFIIVLAYYILTYFLLRLKGVPIPEVIYSMLLCLIAVLVAVLIVNFWWKISVHLTAVGGALGTLIGLSVIHQFDVSGWLYALLSLSGIIAFSRLYLKEHTSSQVYIGFLLGGTVSYWLVSAQIII
jgi:membrane-associated phospholipid phosphatase